MAGDEKELSPRSHEFREFCANTTAHGLGQVALAKSWLERAFWMLIFIFAFIISVYQISRSIQDFLQYPTQTEVTLVNREKLIFPAVTICNTNPFRWSKLKNTSHWENAVSIVILL